MCFHHKSIKISYFGFAPSSGNQTKILFPASAQKLQSMQYS